MWRIRLSREWEWGFSAMEGALSEGIGVRRGPCGASGSGSRGNTNRKELVSGEIYARAESARAREPELGRRGRADRRQVEESVSGLWSTQGNPHTEAGAGPAGMRTTLIHKR